MNANRKAHSYEKNIYEYAKAMAKRWPDPDKLTPAHLRFVTKLFSNASFASFGQR